MEVISAYELQQQQQCLTGTDRWRTSFHYNIDCNRAAWHFESNMIFLVSKQKWYDCRGMYRYRKVTRKIMCDVNVVFTDTAFAFVLSSCRRTVSWPSIRSWGWVGVRRGQWAASGPARWSTCIRTPRYTHVHTGTCTHILFVHSMLACSTGHGWPLAHHLHFPEL